MNRTFRTFLFALIFISGLVSLFASMPAPLHLDARTLNNFGEREYERPVYACQGESIVLSWGGPGDALTLRADPAESFAPPLNRSVAPYGTLQTTVQGGAEITLSKGRNEGVTLPLELVPDPLCTGFGFPLVGLYEGTLTQASPTADPLTRQLALYVAADAGADEGEEEDESSLGGSVAEPVLYLAVGENVERYAQLVAKCALAADTAQLDCLTEGEDGSRFQVNAQIVERGLSGSYSGVSVDVGSAIPFAGTLNFGKAPLPEQPWE